MSSFCETSRSSALFSDFSVASTISSADSPSHADRPSKRHRSHDDDDDDISSITDIDLLNAQIRSILLSSSECLSSIQNAREQLKRYHALDSLSERSLEAHEQGFRRRLASCNDLEVQMDELETSIDDYASGRRAMSDAGQRPPLSRSQLPPSPLYEAYQVDSLQDAMESSIVDLPPVADSDDSHRRLRAIQEDVRILPKPNLLFNMMNPTSSSRTTVSLSTPFMSTLLRPPKNSMDSAPTTTIITPIPSPVNISPSAASASNFVPSSPSRPAHRKTLSNLSDQYAKGSLRWSGSSNSGLKDGLSAQERLARLVGGR